MLVNRLVVGYLEENCYILEKNNEVLIIDPGAEYYKIKEILKDKNLIGILITHRHFDHIGALEELLSDYKVPVYDNNNTTEKEYTLNDFTFKVINTYGHTNDSITFYFYQEKIMFTGDFVFKNTIGRTDLPTGNYNEMYFSIKKIKEYNDDITIYPGHGDKTKLGYEKRNNKYFKL